MENPATWGPVERCISKHIHKPAIIIAQELKNSKLLPEGTDVLALSDKFEETIKHHRDLMAQGFCGRSLQSMLASHVRG